MGKLKSVFYPRAESEVESYYDNAEGKLVDKYAEKYGITKSKMDLVTKHNVNIPLSEKACVAAAAASVSATEIKVKEFASGKTDLLDVLNDINKSPLLVEEDAKDLGMRKEHLPPNPNEAKPKVSHITNLPDQIIVDWVKSVWAGAIIYVSNDGISFTKLEKDTRSPFIDTRMNQKPGTPENRYYKLRYFDNKDTEIGLYSDVITVVAAIYPAEMPPVAVPVV